MIQIEDPAESGAFVVHLRANRSLFRKDLRRIVALQRPALALVSLAGTIGGNVFAPGFALLVAKVVATVFSRVWRRAGCAQRIRMDADSIVVEDWPADRVQEFATYRAKLVLEPARHSGWPRRLLLVSRGDRLEIGAFLTESERTELAGRLATLRAGFDDRQRSARMGWL